MKTRFNRMLSLLCAVMMMISVISVWAAAEEMPATPTDLAPAEEEPAEEKQEEPVEEQQEEQQEEQKEEPAEEEAADSEEIIITKALTLGQSWSGRMSKKKFAVLKLDLTSACHVNMVVEGKDVWATIEKADRRTENPERTESDPDGLMVVSWNAEAGSYLITLGPVAPNHLAMATVTFMTDSAYKAWEAARAVEEPEPEEEPESEPEYEPEPEPESETEPEAEPGPDIEFETDTEPEAEPENEPEEEQPTENKPKSVTEQERHITVDVTWDVPDPVIGDTAHFKAILEGYDNLQYTMQWQYSPDRETWSDILGETDPTMDVVVDELNNTVWWRILVYVEDEQEK